MIILGRTFIALVLSLSYTLSSCTEKETFRLSKTAKVHLQESASGYELIRNGEPFYIKGACGTEFFKELREAGANTVRVYDTTGLKATLNRAETHGLAVVVDIPFPRYVEPDTLFSNKEFMAEHYANIERFVKQYKDHPALLYWMLGNEISYPDLPGDDNVTEQFNTFVDMIHEVDKNHPVSTAVGGFNRSCLLSIITRSGGIDFISINIFGELSTFQERKNAISLLWDGPYVLSEFGINGPWEAKETTWGVPIEENSTKKAELFKERYRKYIKTIDDGRLLGSLFFYWGNKQERTHTWFSTIMDNGNRTENAHVFEDIWKNRQTAFEGPLIDRALLNGDRTGKKSVFGPGENANANLLMLPENPDKKYITEWEIIPENWNYAIDAVEEKPEALNGLVIDSDTDSVTFVTPEKEGPYRLFVTIADENRNIATTNIPFYILDPKE